MKACESYIDLMMRSIDRETTPQEEAELQAHLAQCAACRALYETYRALDSRISAAEEEPPETLTAAVMNSIRAEQKQRSPKHLLRRFRFTAIAAVAAVLVLVFARFQPDSASVTEGTMRAARSMDTAASQENAEYQAAAEVPAALVPAPAEEAEMEEAAEEEAPEECAPETVEMPMEAAEDTAETVTAKESDGAFNLSEQVDAIHTLGLSGDVFLVSNISEEDLQTLFSEVTSITLENGTVVYEAPADAVELAAAAGELSVLETVDDERDSERCYLMIAD